MQLHEFRYCLRKLGIQGCLLIGFGDGRRDIFLCMTMLLLYFVVVVVVGVVLLRLRLYRGRRGTAKHEARLTDGIKKGKFGSRLDRVSRRQGQVMEQGGVQQTRYVKVAFSLKKVHLFLRQNPFLVGGPYNGRHNPKG